jgi:hepatocyte growth factor-regulated tyrosine kinase substrate
MHDKLSQAVKLYDQLLTEQLSRPSRRAYTTHVATPTLHQQQTPPFSPVHATYNQWNNSPQQMPTTGLISQSQMQSSLSHYSVPIAHATYHSSPSELSQPLQQSVRAQYPEPGPSLPPSAVPQHDQYQPAPPSSFASVNPPQTLPPVSIPRSPIQQQYLPQQQQQHSQPPQSPIPTQPQAPARHNSVQSFAVSPSPSIQTTLSRHHTIAYAPPPPQFTPSAPTPLPNFPAVPTTAPQPYTMYESNMPAGVEQTEKKEALLIDLFD